MTVRATGPITSDGWMWSAIGVVLLLGQAHAFGLVHLAAGDNAPFVDV